jgi:hypothetical protein
VGVTANGATGSPTVSEGYDGITLSAGLSNGTTTTPMNVGGDQVTTSVSVNINYDGSNLSASPLSPQTASDIAFGGSAAIAGRGVLPQIGNYFQTAWNWFYIGSQDCVVDGVC